MVIESNELLDSLRKQITRRELSFSDEQKKRLDVRKGFWIPAVHQLLLDVVEGRLPSDELTAVLGSYIALENILEVTDSLTHCLNHEGLIEYGKIAVIEARRRNEPLIFAMFDTDNFRLFNDQYGHGVGDEVLENLVKEMDRLKRKNDVIGRWGGEEFGLILSNTNSDQAEIVLERIRAGIAQNLASTITKTRIDNPITISGGFSKFFLEGKTDDFMSLANRADSALHVAKGKWTASGIPNIGRNRIILWQQSFPSAG